MPNSSAESFFLKKLFNILNESGIKYAVMRNHETLPYSAGGSDLDIILATKDAVRSKALIYEAVHSVGGVALGISETVGFFKMYVLGRHPENKDAWWGQRIDVNVGLFFKGQCQISEDEKWPTHIYRGIPVLSDGFAGVLGVLKEVLNNSIIPTRYLSAASQGLVDEWPAISRCLSPMGSTALGKLATLLTTNDSPIAQKNACKQFTSVFLRYVRRQSITGYISGRLSYEWSKILRYFYPAGKVIAILGVDGAGKSTVINALKPVLDAATHNATVVQHLRPTLIPPLARLRGKGAIPTGSILDPHGAKSSGPMGSFLRLLYLMLDYILGYWLRTRLQIAKQPTIIIFDRYAYDMALDPKRFRIALPSKFIRFFTKLAPKPDLIFCLYGNSAVLAARKQELPLAEVERQVVALKAFAATEPRAVLISTEGSVEEARDQVLEAIINHCARLASEQLHGG